MDKATIKKMRDYADEHDIPMVIYGDNEHLFYHNTKDHYPLIWDDDNNMVFAFQHNNDPYVQQEYPLDIVCIEYEFIQYIKLIANREVALDVFNNHKSLLNEEDSKRTLEMLSDSFRTSSFVTRFKGQKSEN